MRSIDRSLVAALVAALLLGGCAGPPPKPVITTTAETPKVEVDLLEVAAKEYTKALAAMQGFKYKEAEPLLLEMTRKYPTYAGPYGNLGIVYMKTSRAKEAEQAFKKAIELNPKIASVHNQLGLLYREQGRFEEARQAYEKAVEANPDYALVYLNLGILYDLYLLRERDALKHYLRYQELAKPGERDPIHKWIADLTNRSKPVESPPGQ